MDDCDDRVVALWDGLPQCKSWLSGVDACDGRMTWWLVGGCDGWTTEWWLGGRLRWMTGCGLVMDDCDTVDDRLWLGAAMHVG